MGGTRFMVQWEEHPSHLATRLGQLLEHQTLVDVTLMCNTHTLRVHRAVLAACSPYFETILQRQLGMYPLIVLKDMQFSVLKSLIEFMYCGETSVTEDNLSALLQAAKFFQVKGLSAMTKEALGLTSPATPKTTTTVNGEAARKAFVGRSKRVGMQQTFVASGLKSVTASSSHVHGAGGDGHTTTTGKTIFQTTPKSVPVRQDTHQQQQQTDTAQLLLSLSGSDYHKQTFHTVSKNVRFHHGASSGNVTVEPSRTCSLDSSLVKNKELPVKPEVIDRVPVVTPDGGMKSTSGILPAQLAEKGLDQQVIPEKTVEATKDDATSQMLYVEDGHCKRGRPLKRQMNLVFQEKVLTDAEMALQKEAEASRKALEMLQQEMSTGDEAASTVVNQQTESVQQKVALKQPITKLQPSQVNNMTATTSTRILPKEPTTTSKLANQKTNIITQSAVSTTDAGSQNVIYQVAGNAIDSNGNETNIVYQLQEGQDTGSTNIVYQVADNSVLGEQDSNNQNIIYQVADGAGTSTEGNNTNIIYQVADGSTGTGTTMSQYMEVLKEAGLPSDVPILLESSDGSYVSVNEEVLMNIMNGGMIQVGEGIVGGENVQFIVQEVQEVNEGHIENAAIATEQAVAPDMTPSANAVTEVNNIVSETVAAPSEEMQVSDAGNSLQLNQSVTTASTAPVKHSTYKPAKGQQHKSNTAKSLPLLDVKESTTVTPEKSNLAPFSEPDIKEMLQPESAPMDVTEPTPEVKVPEPTTKSDEVITGGNYGEEAVEGFAVTETKDNAEDTKMDLSKPNASDFMNPVQSSDNEINKEDKSFPPMDKEPVKAVKTDVTPAGGNISVEQALQAMMGDGSDTEMEVCASMDADGTTKVKPVISHHDTKGRSTPNESSIDEETEDLRLVLSPEDDSIKVEEESQSAEGSINESFTLALSSPDSTGNEKSHLEADNVTESTEESQQHEIKPVEAVSEPEILKDTTTDEGGALTCESNSTAATSCNEISESVSGEMSTDSSSLDVRADESMNQTSAVAVSESDGDAVLKLEKPSSPLTTVDDENSEKIKSSETESQSFNDEPVGDVQTGLKDLTVEKTTESGEALETPTVDNVDIENDNNDDNLLPEKSVSKSVEFQAGAPYSNDGTSDSKSLPILSTDDSESLAENKCDNYDNIGEDELKSGRGNSSVSELAHNELTKLLTDPENSECDNIKKDIDEDNLISESHILGSTDVSVNETDVKDTVQKDEMRETEGAVDEVVENQGSDVLDGNNPNTGDKNPAAEGGTVTSPCKDIPYAVGLLPLKTALEKLQAMPEYHPRKTRSASSSKEPNEVPAARLKRKSSSTTEYSDKKLKSDDGEFSPDEESVIVASEELGECDENETSQSCLMETESDNNMIEPPVIEEPMEVREVEDKVEPLPSMMELVSDSSEAV